MMMAMHISVLLTVQANKSKYICSNHHKALMITHVKKVTTLIL